MGSQVITIWWKLKAVCDVVLVNCFIIAWIVSATTFGLSTAGIVSIVLSIVLPIALILILMCRSLVAGYSIKDALNDILLMLPLVNVLLLFYLIYKKKFYGWMFFQTSFFNLMFLLGISVSNSISGFYSEDTVTFAASITMVVLLPVAFISFVILWWKAFQYGAYYRLTRWIPVCNVGFLIVVVIATISWMAFKGLRPEDVGVAITSMVGLVFSTAYAIIFMCWSRKGSPEDKQWWWCLNICNIVALVFILVALICWIVSKDQSCKTNIPVWIILTVSAITFVIVLSRSFPVCSRNEGTNENNHAEIEQPRRDGASWSPFSVTAFHSSGNHISYITSEMRLSTSPTSFPDWETVPSSERGRAVAPYCGPHHAQAP
ncbi:uncharacterized protein [Hemitrygon akajei]|uniref:uncharacterized protein n=1 Tax=Hemitrygon akajei TaxID=2704970 RepID=UPI003BFA16BA